jgi:hypothetical protein
MGWTAQVLSPLVGSWPSDARRSSILLSSDSWSLSGIGINFVSLFGIFFIFSPNLKQIPNLGRL